MTNANQNTGNKEKILKENLKERIEAKLITRGIYNPECASDEQIYQATVSAIKDIMLEYRDSFKKRIKEKHAKKVCYLCMEFLVGRSLRNDAENLGIYPELCEVFGEFGTSFDKVFACEVDPGLGKISL